MSRPLIALILAAGLGKRMKSERPKVLHRVCGRPMIDYVIDSVQGIGAQQIYAVIGHKGEQVEAHLDGRAHCVLQSERLGTGHAVLQAREALRDFDGDVLILCGDTPLIRQNTLQDFVRRHQELGGAGVVLATQLANPFGYGRVIRDEQGRALRIVEQKDATPEEALVREVNSGIYCVDCRALFSALDQVGNQNAQGEYYLTDIVGILAREGRPIHAVIGGDPSELVGINSRLDLAAAEKILRLRVVEEYMAAGLTVIDPATTWIEPGSTFGMDVVIHPFTFIRGKCVMDDEAEIGPSSEVVNCTIGRKAIIRQSVCENQIIAYGEVIGPFEVRKS